MINTVIHLLHYMQYAFSITANIAAIRYEYLAILKVNYVAMVTADKCSVMDSFNYV